LLLGRRDGFTALAERVVEAQPFAAQSTGTVECAVAADAVEGLVELGERTRTEAATADVAAALADVVERFTTWYRPSDRVSASLADAIATIGASKGPLPLVGMHGDPGPQNLLVADGGRVVVLDWENWEAAGLPLWDVAHFVRAYVVWATRKSRPVSRLGAVRTQFVDGGQLTPFVARSLTVAAERLGIDGRLIAPLVLTSFVAQAVREADRLEPERLGSGHNVQVLELLCGAIDGPVTGRLLSGAGTTGLAPT
jgi:hypothetical protein